MRVGEEPELGVRLRALGWRFRHLDRSMVRHDLGLRSLGDWVARGYQNGLSCAMVVRATGGLRRGFWRERLVRTLALAALLTGPPVLGLALLAFEPAIALGLLACAPLALILLAARKSLVARTRGLVASHAVAFGLHTYLVKVPTAAGILAALIGRLPRDPGRPAE